MGFNFFTADLESFFFLSLIAFDSTQVTLISDPDNGFYRVRERVFIDLSACHNDITALNATGSFDNDLITDLRVIGFRVEIIYFSYAFKAYTYYFKH